MSIVDILIIIFLVFGALLGFKRGVFRELVSALGFILSVIFAFLLKGPVSNFLYEHLPFFNFGGIFKGVSVLNIIVYEVIAFLIMLSIFLLLCQLLKIVTNIIEKVLTATIILGIPSKIAGAVVGVIYSYIIIFIVLYILSLPVISLDIIKDSKFKNNILTKTPLLSSFIDKSIDIFEEFDGLKEKYKESENASEFNNEALDLLLKYKVVSTDSVQKLIDNKKLDVDQKILDKYKEE